MGMRTRLANLYVLRGDLDQAERLLDEVRGDEAAQSTPWLRAMTCYSLALLARRRGRPDEALEWLGPAWELARSRQAPVVASMLQVAMGFAHDQLGDPEAALAHHLEALRFASGQPSPRTVSHALEGLAGALAARGTVVDATRAAHLLGTADALRVRSGGALPRGERFDVDRAERRIRDVLGDAATEDALAAGALEPLDEVVGSFLQG
jgi:tetratricopeptide (TPR) repeat protein